MSVVDVLARSHAAASDVLLIGEQRAWTRAELDRDVDLLASALLASGVTGPVAPVVLDADPAGVMELLARWRLGLTPAPLSRMLTEAERDAAKKTLASAAADAQAILWTSGTAGKPRGVALSYAGLEANAWASAERLGLAPSDVWLASLAPAHVGGLALIARAVLLGCRLIAVGPVAPAQILRLLRGGTTHTPPVTHLSLVPTQLLKLLDETRDGRAPASLRCVLLGGAGTPAGLLARALDAGWPVALTYGLTEATSQVATSPPDATRRKPGSVGRPLMGVDVHVELDGEILVRGDTLASGYVGDGAGPLMDASGWHHTGDIGRFDEDGDLWVTGRRVDRIVTGGVTVDAVEVEEALRSHPSVSDACVVGIEDPAWGERVVAWVEPRDGSVDPDRLDEYLRERLAAPKLPRRYHVEAGLPRNANGKVNRAAVRAAFGVTI